MILTNICIEHPKDIIIGVDEASRGTLFGRVYAGAVLWDNNFQDDNLKFIKDSKKLSKKKREEMRVFIEENCLAYGVGYVENNEIDEINILNASIKAMHIAIDNLFINIKAKKGNIDNILNYNFDRILVDGNKFKTYICKPGTISSRVGFIPHTCVIKGDSINLSIAAASILAKTYHDKYINDLCDREVDLEKYNLRQNQGYGTKKHYEALLLYGVTKYHRKSFNLHLDTNT